MDKSVVQRVYEFVAAAGREVASREVLSAVSDAKASAVTFALSRLARSGELVRTTHGRYRVGESPENARVVHILDDPYHLYLLERIRPVLAFADLAYVYAVFEAGRALVPPDLAKHAQARVEQLRGANA